MKQDIGIGYELRDGVAVVTIDRPDCLNALDHVAARELIAVLDRACADGARALVLTGAGRFFSSGGDLTADIDLDDIGGPMEEIWNPLSEKLMDLPMPVITAMNGPAIGVSCAIALLGDIVIADRSSYFLFSFANLGLIPDGGGTWLLTRSIGRHRAMQLIMLAGRLGAEEAERWGMVYRVVDDGDALNQALELAERLAKGPTQAYKLMRQSMRAALEGGFTESLQRERVLQKDAGRSKDFAKSLNAFAQKRPPTFTGS